VGLYEFLYPDKARVRRLEREVAGLRADAASDDADEIRDRLRRQWEEKHLPKPGTDPAEKVALLEQRCASLDLIVEALLEELEARGGISRDELKKRMHEIDARDGKVDGRKSV